MRWMRERSVALALVVGAVVTLTGSVAVAAQPPTDQRATPRAAPSGFKEVSSKKEAAILRALVASGAIASGSARCWGVYVTQSSGKWGSYRPSNASGCPVSEGLTAIRKATGAWTSIPIAGSSLPCAYLASELRKRGATTGVIRDFTSGWPCF